MSSNAGETPDGNLTLRAFQQHIADLYLEQDKARGTAGTFLWLAEEFGELARALGNKQRGKPDQANLEEEFADMIAWLCTLANINDVDLTEAIRRKYLGDKPPQGVK